MLKTRNGHEARIISFGHQLIGGRSIIAIHKVNDKEWGLNSWYENGRFYPPVKGVYRDDSLDLMLEEENA